MTIVSANLVESPDWGRRPLLLTGTTAMAVSLFGLSALYATAGPALAAGGAGAIGAQAGVIALLFMFVGGYQIGFGPITWLVLSEIFPAAVRSPAMSIGTLLNFGSNYAVGTLFELERVQVGEPVLFAFFGGVSLLALLFIYTKVPETRGLSLEQIEEKLKGGGPLS
ncbi:general substrate transporter [Pavlovales sp. CCMP2436]|nr:general substrate transporter [Pavlovales sp. CCMP2436]